MAESEIVPREEAKRIMSRSLIGGSPEADDLLRRFDEAGLTIVAVEVELTEEGRAYLAQREVTHG